MADFQAGDLVQLKSGGPAMTVDSIAPNGARVPRPIAKCSWFDDQHKRHTEDFEVPSLKKWEPPTYGV